MQLRHVKTVLSAQVRLYSDHDNLLSSCCCNMRILHSAHIQDAPVKISAIAWSPNNNKLAVATADRTVYLFDDQGEKKDKFPTKPADASVSLRPPYSAGRKRVHGAQ